MNGRPTPPLCAVDAAPSNGAPEALFSNASRTCDRAMPSELIATSADAGWTSILLEHRQSEANVPAFETEPTPDQRIVVMTRGELNLESFKGGLWRKAIYRVGSAGMTAGGDTSRLRWSTRRPAREGRTAHLYIPQRFFYEAAEHYRSIGRTYRDEPLSALSFHDPAIAQGVLALLHAMDAGAPDFYAESLINWLATHLLSKHSNWLGVSEDRRHPGVISDERLARVIEYISAHLNKTLTLEQLSREAGISKFHFSRIFRERTGLTPYGFVIQLRLDAAYRLLTTSDLTVAEVAAACGYDRAAHFSAAFLRRFSLAPTTLRKRLRS